MQQLDQRKQEIKDKYDSLLQRKNELRVFIQQKTSEMQQLKGRFNELENFKQNNQDFEDEKIKDLLVHCDNRQKEYQDNFEQCKEEISKVQQEVNQIDAELEQLEGSYDEVKQLEKFWEQFD